jgi:hypothetical protein
MAVAAAGDGHRLQGPGVVGPATGGRPWRLLAAHTDQLAGHIGQLQVSVLGFGTGYLAHTPAAAPEKCPFGDRFSA